MEREIAKGLPITVCEDRMEGVEGQAAHVYLETLENAEEQGKEPDETGIWAVGGEKRASPCEMRYVCAML